jgi:hypothetical protein
MGIFSQLPTWHVCYIHTATFYKKFPSILTLRHIMHLIGVWLLTSMPIRIQTFLLKRGRGWQQHWIHPKQKIVFNIKHCNESPALRPWQHQFKGRTRFVCSVPNLICKVNLPRALKFLFSLINSTLPNINIKVYYKRVFFLLLNRNRQLVVVNITGHKRAIYCRVSRGSKNKTPL